MKLTTIFIHLILCSVFPLLANAQGKNAFPYNLEKPDDLFVMPSFLEEISGLTYLAPNQLAALNDEHGRIYVYDIEKKKIVQRIRFEGNGDFEGLELVEKDMYAIKSNGQMFRFNIEVDGDVETIDGPFNHNNNLEGLGYDKKSNNLLLALKESGDVAGVKVKGKAVYGYNLSSKTFSKTPLFVLNDADLERVLGANRTKLRPSGIAVHPINGDIYMVASVGGALVVFDNSGKPKNLTLLKKSLFPQPEGITFSPNGDLFISNEGDGDGGTILRFKMKK
uniref:SdiA-regulated domain-containing protein n=1 Tax=Roseivirga sp. TaxID=1964215 RepID=UPI0040474E50